MRFKFEPYFLIEDETLLDCAKLKPTVGALPCVCTLLAYRSHALQLFCKRY